MAWFSRKGSDGGAADRGAAPTATRPDGAGTGPDGGDDAPEFDPTIPLRPRLREVGVTERSRVDAGLARLGELGVDVDDLAALGAAYDVAVGQWRATSPRSRGDEEAAREPWVIGLGEHLVRHTDLGWSLVRDAFGTDLAVAGGKDDFVVVPANLVGGRWLNGETGWLPGVVGHLVRVRESRREA